VRPATLRAGGAFVALREGTVRLGPLEFEVAMRDEGSGLRLDWSVRNAGRADIRLDALGVGIDDRPELVLEHGWQSWVGGAPVPAG